MESAHKESKNSAHTDGEIEKRRALSGYAAANPTKSPSAGLHKPTWKPSAKPAEHASKQGAALPRQLSSKSSSSSSSKDVSSTTLIEDLQKSLMKATKKGDYVTAATIGKELIAAQGNECIYYLTLTIPYT